MDEYIDRDEVIAWIWKQKRLSKGYAVMVIQDLPAADVAPVRHGKWMPFHAEFAGDIQYCSVCEIGFSDRTAYCPHCGAVMDGWRKEAAENE